MKNLRNILSIGLVAFAASSIYGCELKPKKEKAERLLSTTFITTSEKPKNVEHAKSNSATNSKRQSGCNGKNDGCLLPKDLLP